MAVVVQVVVVIVVVNWLKGNAMGTSAAYLAVVVVQLAVVVLAYC